MPEEKIWKCVRVKTNAYGEIIITTDGNTMRFDGMDIIPVGVELSKCIFSDIPVVAIIPEINYEG